MHDPENTLSSYSVSMDSVGALYTVSMNTGFYASVIVPTVSRPINSDLLNIFNY